MSRSTGTGYLSFLFDRLVRYLLFADEASLAGQVIQRNTQFEKDFREGRRTTSDGLSLKDFSLNGRMFEHRLSYMIQSRSFIESPQAMKDRVYNRLWGILSAEAPPEGFDFFAPGERDRIIHILRETHDDLPDQWRETLVAAE